MSDDRTFERNARAWLELGPTDAPDRVVESALLTIEKTNQERDLGIPWRLPAMNPIMRLAAVLVVGALAVGGALYLTRGQTQSVGNQSPPPSIEGTWETTFTRAQMQSAGLVDAGEDIPENYGHFVLSIHGGNVVTVQLSDPKTGGSVGTYVVNGNTYTVTTPSNATFSWSFTVTATTLTFGGTGPVTLRVTPWTRIGP
jgi:hypothetical protein